MLRPWTKLLPLILIEYIANRKCEVFTIKIGTSNMTREVVCPYFGVMFYVKKKDGEQK